MSHISPEVIQKLCEYYEGQISRESLDEHFKQFLLSCPEDKYSVDWLFSQSVLHNELENKDLETILRDEPTSELRRTLLYMLACSLAVPKHCNLGDLFKVRGKPKDVKRLRLFTNFSDAVRASSLVDAPVSVLMGGNIPAPVEELSWYRHTGLKSETDMFAKAADAKYQFKACRFHLDKRGRYDAGLTVFINKGKFTQVTFTVDGNTPLKRWDYELISLGQKHGLVGPSIFIDSSPVLQSGGQKLYRMIWPHYGLRGFTGKHIGLEPASRLMLYTRIFTSRTNEVSIWAGSNSPQITIRYPHRRNAETIRALVDLGILTLSQRTPRAISAKLK